MRLYLVWLLLTSFAIYEIYQLQVDPQEFAVSHSERIDANPTIFFNFITQTHMLEKLLPWFNGLKEADSKILGVRKFYKAFDKILIGGENIHLMIVEFRSGKYLALESQDQSIKQRIEIRTKCYHNQSILTVTVYSQRTAFLFHHTIGRIIQDFIRRNLEKSLLHVNQVYKAIENELQILHS
ncbi:uncharacterized protein [Chelonus insularis]|uniref:uncharacterized protein n=1 Tax=Chelonus insularis TaxID=460826 RepID=UPI001589C3A2|nr:uncharacterized protein LOC118074996 [Chelonus insularis]